MSPAAVAAESASDPSRPDGVLIRRRIDEGLLRVRNVAEPGVTTRLLQDFRLGRGEAEALALALEAEGPAVVVTDDRNAIRACKVLRIDFVTSLGILVRAVEKGLLSRDEGIRCLARLRSYGRFKAEVLDEVSRQIGGTADGESAEDS